MREELFECPKGRSETIPNQALHISELMNRSARLQHIPYLPDSEDDEDNIDIDFNDDVEDRFDVIDRLSYLEARQKEHQRLMDEAAKEKSKATEEESESDATKEA